MACVPMLNRRKCYRFEAIIRLHSLVSVPYVNAVMFAKLRLLGSRHSSQYSPRVEIRQHTAIWNTEHRFLCKFRSSADAKILEPNILKISVRMETKGGKSFCKLGYVSVDLACFTALGNAVSRRRYILEGYNEQHKRLDNSLLNVSFSMRQLFGDTCFRPPPENLSNCLIEPPDSETEAVPLLLTEKEHTAPAQPSAPDQHSSERPPSCIDRILADTYAIQPPRTISSQSPALTGLSTQAACDRLQSMWRSQGNPSTMSPDQLTRLLDKIMVPPSDKPIELSSSSRSNQYSSEVDQVTGKTTSQNGSSSQTSHVADQGDIDRLSSTTNRPQSRSPSSNTSSSQSTSPDSTPTDSPARCPLGGGHLPSCSAKPPNRSPDQCPPSSCAGDTEPLFGAFNQIQCHSLPHHTSLHTKLLGGARSKVPEHFATDSGLLGPSRRRKIRPRAADLVFTSAEQGPSTTIPTTHPSTTGVGSHSSGYQSHSRQSSLESQTAAGTGASSIMTDSSGCSTKLSGSSSVLKTAGIFAQPAVTSPQSPAH